MAIITSKMIWVRKAEFGLAGRARFLKIFLRNRRKSKPQGAIGIATAWTGLIHRTLFSAIDQMIKNRGPGPEEDAAQTPAAGQ